jgi:hypothetical protein
MFFMLQELLANIAPKKPNWDLKRDLQGESQTRLKLVMDLCSVCRRIFLRVK